MSRNSSSNFGPYFIRKFCKNNKKPTWTSYIENHLSFMYFFAYVLMYFGCEALKIYSPRCQDQNKLKNVEKLKADLLKIKNNHQEIRLKTTVWGSIQWVSRETPLSCWGSYQSKFELRLVSVIFCTFVGCFASNCVILLHFLWDSLEI
jgi:hypothetical protein